MGLLAPLADGTYAVNQGAICYLRGVGLAAFAQADALRSLRLSGWDVLTYGTEGADGLAYAVWTLATRRPSALFVPRLDVAPLSIACYLLRRSWASPPED